MKTLIVIREADYGWLTPLFPGVHPLVMPICNKPFIEYLIDFSILAGSTAVRIVSDGPLNDVERYCENGSRWGIDISYASILVDDDLDAVMDKNARYCSEGRMMVTSGFIFISYEKKHELKPFVAMAPAGTLLRGSTGSLLLTGTPENVGEVREPAPCSLVELDSIGSYYRLSTEILNERPSPYVLPGYSNEPDCHIGRNVVTSKGAEIIKPVIIGNNVQIMKGAVVGPFAVIGSNVIVDRESTVSNSMLLDNTYIGENLDIVGRIAYGNILIDPASGVSIAMEDRHLLSGMKRDGIFGLGLFRYLFHAAVSLLFILLLFIPYLLLAPLLKIQGKWKNRTMTFQGVQQGKNVIVVRPSIAGEGVLSGLARSLSLDRFAMLFSALSGRVAVIGSFPVEAGRHQEAATSVLMPGYRPAVFSYAEAEDWPVNAEDSSIVERYYAVHGSPVQDMVLTVKAFLNRIHAQDQP
ncbi:MAG: NDP-sugar synthase [Chlorobiaceae bacterium]|nr:NDP-sugar synthase [Chlorobiaceae bacterium]NTW74080.1 NDP-sugar synthase [Chlorobiaceae bacterium]